MGAGAQPDEKNLCDRRPKKISRVLVDAEETWIQDPVDVLCIQMMAEYNKEKVAVYNTVQLYRHDRLSFLKDMLEAAVLKDFVLGVKLVRGAYMEKERARAEEKQYIFTHTTGQGIDRPGLQCGCCILH